MRIDFGPTSEDYATYRTEFAPQLFDRLHTFHIGFPKQKILDLGAGTGLFARKLVECGSDVILVDASKTLLQRCTLLSRIVAVSELLPFGDESFDVVTAAQCWHWFDRARAPKEIARVLRNEGSLVVVYQTYIPLLQSVAAATEQLILKHNPAWRHANSTGVNGQVLRDMQSAGFIGIESFSFDVDVQFSRDAWRGFVRTTSPIGASMNPQQIEQFDSEHQALLKSWPEELRIPHRIFVAIARKPRKGI